MGSFRIAVVAPGGRIAPEVAERALALCASVYPAGEVEIHFHPQCFMSSGHFAGDDATRAAALIEAANDPAFDAVWFARGGYGSCRIAQTVIGALAPAASVKTFLGYSDCGALLGALYGAGIGKPVHGPMPGDIAREGGEAALKRSLSYLVSQSAETLEPNLDADTPVVAYNIAVLSSVLGTALEPPLKDHLLMLEEVGEYMYRLDRYMFHITSSPAVRSVAGIRLGRVSATLANTPEFGALEDEMMDGWCAKAGIPYLGRADIGHDIDNRIVPFGACAQP